MFTNFDIQNSVKYSNLFITKATFLYLREIRPEIFSHIDYKEVKIDLKNMFYVSQKLNALIEKRQRKLNFLLYFNKYSCEKLSCYMFLKGNRLCDKNSKQTFWMSGNTTISSCQAACRLLFKTNSKLINKGFDLIFKEGKCLYQNIFIKKFATDPEGRSLFKQKNKNSNTLPGFDFDESSNIMYINKDYCNYFNQYFDETNKSCYFSSMSTVSNFIFGKTITSTPSFVINDFKYEYKLSKPGNIFFISDENWLNDKKNYLYEDLFLEFSITGKLDIGYFLKTKKNVKKRDLTVHSLDSERIDKFINDVFEIIDNNLFLSSITSTLIDSTISFSLSNLNKLIKNRLINLIKSNTFCFISHLRFKMSSKFFNYCIATATSRLTLIMLSNIASSVAIKLLSLTSSALSVVGWGIFVASIVGMFIDSLWDPYDFNKQINKNILSEINERLKNQFKIHLGYTIYEKSELEFTPSELINLIVSDLTLEEKQNYESLILNVTIASQFEYLDSLNNFKKNEIKEYNLKEEELVDFEIDYNNQIEKYLTDNNFEEKKFVDTNTYTKINNILSVLNTICLSFTLIIYLKNNLSAIYFFCCLTFFYYIYILLLFKKFNI